MQDHAVRGRLNAWLLDALDGYMHRKDAPLRARLLGAAPGPVVRRRSRVRRERPILSPGTRVVAVEPNVHVHPRLRRRAALAAAALEPEPVPVVRRLLGRIAADVAARRRSVDDTVHVFTQMRRMVALPPEVARALDEHEDGYRLAVAGVEGRVDEVRSRIASWLAMHADGARAA